MSPVCAKRNSPLSYSKGAGAQREFIKKKKKKIEKGDFYHKCLVEKYICSKCIGLLGSTASCNRIVLLYPHTLSCLVEVLPSVRFLWSFAEGTLVEGKAKMD